ncbi:glycoside hydrolase family 32 protein [Croceitalea dokdonensis]|nr:glycoside hydrolase family 32 protein [Croceitalea dokdonensis]
MKNKFLFLSLLMVFMACRQVPDAKKAPKRETAVYKEQYRPQYHFTPQEKWMNDPNGLVYHDGVYHLFYQYYPEDIVWGPMHWGHAVSKDMVHWQHKPIALYPDENGLIFSGSAVVDKNNTSGFGKDGKVPLVAVFTYHSMEGEKAGRKDFQTQGIAYSLDNGDSWVKYANNPVIGNSGIKDFRDPKVFWHEDGQQWIMALVAGDHAQFYSSKNLREWTYLSDFGKENGAHGGVWECPDLFPMKVAGSDEVKWVLLISINPGAPNGGSGTQYFVGDFDGQRFTTTQKDIKWLDWGTDNYAGVTYNNTPEDQRIFIGWMSNWDYARDTPTKKWRSAMTVPRSLELHQIHGDFVLKNYPLEAVDGLAEKVEGTIIAVGPNDKKQIGHAALNQSDISFETATDRLLLQFTNDKGDTLRMSYDRPNKEFLFDRTKSGLVDFQKDFAKGTHRMPLEHLPQDKVEIRMLMDWSSVEVFINKGQQVMTHQVFPKELYSKLTIINDTETSMELTHFKIEPIPSVW